MTDTNTQNKKGGQMEKLKEMKGKRGEEGGNLMRKGRTENKT